MENMSWMEVALPPFPAPCSPPPSSSQPPWLAPLLWLLFDTGAGLYFCERTITIHSLPLLPHAHVLLRVGSPACLASMGTLGELLFASGKLGNLSAACSGLSKTTVAFSYVRTHTYTQQLGHSHALCSHPAFVLASPFFPLHSNLLTLCFFATAL